jgi:hypothetical protein
VSFPDTHTPTIPNPPNQQCSSKRSPSRYPLKALTMPLGHDTSTASFICRVEHPRRGCITTPHHPNCRWFLGHHPRVTLPPRRPRHVPVKSSLPLHQQRLTRTGRVWRTLGKRRMHELKQKGKRPRNRKEVRRANQMRYGPLGVFSELIREPYAVIRDCTQL